MKCLSESPLSLGGYILTTKLLGFQKFSVRLQHYKTPYSTNSSYNTKRQYYSLIFGTWGNGVNNALLANFYSKFHETISSKENLLTAHTTATKTHGLRYKVSRQNTQATQCHDKMQDVEDWIREDSRCSRHAWGGGCAPADPGPTARHA